MGMLGNLVVVAVLLALIKPVRYVYNNFLPEKVLHKLVRFWDKVFLAIIWIFAGMTVAALGFIIFHVLSNGLPHLTIPGLFSFDAPPETVTLIPAIVSTFIMVALVLLIAVPLGVLSAVFLVEYTGAGNKFVTIIRSAAEVLAGIPSIVYGLFGMMFFRVFLGLGMSVLSGTLTMSIMMLPLIMRTTEEALKAVPMTYREASFALGAGKLRTVFRIVLPSAIPGILAGVILAIGRVVGESAALIFTAGALLEPRIPSGLFDTASTLTVHMWQLSNYGRFMNETYAAAVVLLIIVLLLNALSAFIARKFSKV
ncbi:MAG: phosphate ABC transporter permease PstA [Defluviitaleaceae bacterium]|nr:phosphate ABC transporter permease PstA [Defluviitaleaceae bacterium]MCL2261795.1 phosphate ABC transporter permease PstA [Defluviitaleaceae bacterium]